MLVLTVTGAKRDARKEIRSAFLFQAVAHGFLVPPSHDKACDTQYYQILPVTVSYLHTGATASPSTSQKTLATERNGRDMEVLSLSVHPWLRRSICHLRPEATLYASWPNVRKVAVGG